MWTCCFLYLFILPAAVSLLATRIIISVSRRANIVDRPAGRKIHKEPMPLLGGLAIFFSFFGAIILNARLAGIAAANPAGFGFIPPEIFDFLPGVSDAWEKLRVVLYGGALMMLLGLLDDIREIDARIKLGVQTLAAVILVLSGIRITLFVESPLFGGVITVLWVVGITNAFNLLDNMDGLSSGVALIAAGLFFASAWIGGYYFIAAALAVFAGSLAGFLRYNFNPAKIFMGDAGSLFIGYTLAALTVLNRYYAEGSPTLFPVLVPVLIMAVPLFDTGSVIIIRMKNGESIFKPDRRHFSHRLVNLGFSQRQAVLLVYLVCLGGGTGSLLLRQVDAFGAGVILFQAVAVFGIIAAIEAAGSRGNAGRQDIGRG